MKIGIISTSAFTPFGGSEELISAFTNKALSNGNAVAVSIFNWGALHPKWSAVQENGAAIQKRRRVHYPSFFKKMWSKLFLSRLSRAQLAAFVKRHQPDVLVVNLGGFRNIEEKAYLSLLESYEGPYVLIVHGSSESYHSPFMLMERIRKVCERAACVYFVSHRLRSIAERSIGYRFNNSKIIANPVNISVRGILPFPVVQTIHFACVGRLDSVVKGYALLLQVLGQEVWKSRAWQLNIYGNGEDEQYLRYLTTFYALQDKVVFHGYVTDIREEVWANNHLLLLPSYQEGLPLVLVEAMLCARTAVVTDVGGNAEILKDGESGFIADAATFRSFSSAMEAMWSNRQLLASFGKEAYEAAQKYLSDNMGVGELLDDIRLLT